MAWFTAGGCLRYRIELINDAFLTRLLARFQAHVVLVSTLTKFTEKRGYKLLLSGVDIRSHPFSSIVPVLSEINCICDILRFNLLFRLLFMD